MGIPTNYEPHGIRFHSNGREMMLVYGDEPRISLRGWLLCRHPDGQWVTLRKATDDDVQRINEAISRAFHEGYDA